MQLSNFELTLLKLITPNLKLAFDHMDILTILALSKASSTLYAIYKWYSQITWDPTSRYRRWFVHVEAFQHLLKRTNAVISGSFALQFFDRTHYTESDMDIYTRTAGADEFCNWIISQGYRPENQVSTEYEELLTDSLDPRPHRTKAVTNSTSSKQPLLGVYTFIKLVASIHGYTERLSVQVIVVDRDPPEHVLFDFHSTAVMNFITCSTAISIFPFSTFFERVSYITRCPPPTDEHAEDWITKYQKRGFTIFGEWNQASAHQTRLGTRYVTDDCCWQIHFEHEACDHHCTGYYGDAVLNIPFDVLPIASGVVAKGAFLRIAQPYVWRVLSKAQKRPKAHHDSYRFIRQI